MRKLHFFCCCVDEFNVIVVGNIGMLLLRNSFGVRNDGLRRSVHFWKICFKPQYKLRSCYGMSVTVGRDYLEFIRCVALAHAAMRFPGFGEFSRVMCAFPSFRVFPGFVRFFGVLRV